MHSAPCPPMNCGRTAPRGCLWVVPWPHVLRSLGIRLPGLLCSHGNNFHPCVVFVLKPWGCFILAVFSHQTNYLLALCAVQSKAVFCPRRAGVRAGSALLSPSALPGNSSRKLRTVTAPNGREKHRGAAAPEGPVSPPLSGNAGFRKGLLER